MRRKLLLQVGPLGNDFIFEHLGGRRLISLPLWFRTAHFKSQRHCFGLVNVERRVKLYDILSLIYPLQRILLTPKYQHNYHSAFHVYPTKRNNFVFVYSSTLPTIRTPICLLTAAAAQNAKTPHLWTQNLEKVFPRIMGDLKFIQNLFRKNFFLQRWQSECLICRSNRFTIIRLDELQIISFNFDFFFSLTKDEKWSSFGVFLWGLFLPYGRQYPPGRENQFELSQLGQTSLKVGRSTKLPSLWTQLRF